MELSRIGSGKHTALNGREKELEPTDLKSDAGSSTSTLYDNMEPDEKLLKVDVEKQASPTTAAPKEIRTSRLQLLFWMIVNTIATIAIVSKNRL